MRLALQQVHSQPDGFHRRVTFGLVLFFLIDLTSMLSVSWGRWTPGKIRHLRLLH